MERKNIYTQLCTALAQKIIDNGGTYTFRGTKGFYEIINSEAPKTKPMTYWTKKLDKAGFIIKETKHSTTKIWEITHPDAEYIVEKKPVLATRDGKLIFFNHKEL